jgi:hypothetical protein
MRPQLAYYSHYDPKINRHNLLHGYFEMPEYVRNPLADGNRRAFGS